MNRHHGFTLIELLIAMAVAAILAATALPSFQSPLFKARRSDGISALHQLHMSQERWRSEHTGYADAAALKHPTTSPLGHYRLAISDASAQGFTATASAQGSQAGDSACQVMRISVAQGETTYSSGPSADSLNTNATNQRCWNL